MTHCVSRRRSRVSSSRCCEQDGAQASGPSRRPEPARRRCRSPGSRSTSRSPISTGRSTTSCPRPCTSTRSPGCRVKVRFAGRDVDGFVLERADDDRARGRLARLRRVVSPEPVLAPRSLALAAQVADRYAGTLADVLRLAVRRGTPGSRPRTPKARRDPARRAARHARPRPGRPYAGGAAFLDAGWARVSPRARSGRRCPGRPTGPTLAAAAAATRSVRSRQRCCCVPDARDVARLDRRCTTAARARTRHVVLTADLGPAARYRAFLAVRRGQVPVVVGTRAAAFAPVRDLGSGRVWDDGDDLHAEPRAPYPHAREVLLLRAASASGGRAARRARRVGRGAGAGRVAAGPRR